MKELKKQVTTSIKSRFKLNPNMTSTFKDNKPDIDVKIQNSINRGELLRYSNFIPSVKFNIKELKTSNPKYLELAVKIIKISIIPLDGIDLEVPLNILLSQFKDASFNNQEALDFSWEILNQVDTLTAKYYLSTLAAGAISNSNLKRQFKATIPFIKYIIPTLKNSTDLTKQKNFINAIATLINENADPEKIQLLPKIKYVIDSISNQNHIIDVTKIIYSNVSANEINQKLNMLSKENINDFFNFTDYLIKNSL